MSSSDADRALPRIYQELHRIAQQQRRRERDDLTLSTTGLVHEAYLKLFEQSPAEWRDQRHFVALASRAVRQILVDYARTRNRQKRRGNAPHIELDEALVGANDRPEHLLALDDALTELERYDANLSRLVELRYFGGMNMKEAAEELDMSLRSAERAWTRARAFLLAHMSGSLDTE